MNLSYHQLYGSIHLQHLRCIRHLFTSACRWIPIIVADMGVVGSATVTTTYCHREGTTVPDNDDSTQRILKQGEEIGRLTRNALEAMHQRNERDRLAISPAHKRILEYFWNRKRKEERDDLPLAIVYFFESEESSRALQELNESRVNFLVAELIAKGYIDRSTRKPDQLKFMVRAEEVLTLTPQGLKFLYKRHPSAFVWWTKILDATPSSISLAVTVVGLVGAVLGIIDFIRH
jgi:DNA-binding MarR family transcriptional regulator